MALFQAHSLYRRVVIFSFFASLPLAILQHSAFALCIVGQCSLWMASVPCGQRFINRDRNLWILRQSYFVGLGIACLVVAGTGQV